MSNSRSCKFTLKPSTLNQHTANFNKLLEQVPAPKLDPSIQLIKPIDINSFKENANEKASIIERGTVTDKNETTKETKEEKSESNEITSNSLSSDESKNTSTNKEFIFGEKLTDRVIRASTTFASSTSAETTETTTANGSSLPLSQQTATLTATSSTNSKSKQESATESTLTESKHQNGSALWSTNTANTSDANNDDKYLADTFENDSNTILKLNCKLFVLDSNKVSWNERGYGLLKLIDLNDGYNCKIMMWTDKCFRLILNTKLFEKMQIDRANKKSIRFNAFDQGTIRIFLVKMSNQNDCDELFEILKIRLNEYIENIETSKANVSTKTEDSSSSSTSSSSSSSSSSNSLNKTIIFKCECVLYKESLEDSTSAITTITSSPIKSEIRLYTFSPTISNYKLAGSTNPTASNNRQLLLDIFDIDQTNTMYLSTYLKLIALKMDKSQKKDNSLEFEIDESIVLPNTDDSSTKSKTKFKIVLNDKESIGKFLAFYNKEPKLKKNMDDSSNDVDDEEVDDNNQEEDTQTTSENDFYYEKLRTDSINESERFQGSEDGKDESCSQENLETETGETTRKRKSESNQSPENMPPSFKKQDIEKSSPNKTSSSASSNETDTICNNKRNAEESFDQENDDKNLKKSKTSNNDPTEESL